MPSLSRYHSARSIKARGSFRSWLVLYESTCGVCDYSDVRPLLLLVAGGCYAQTVGVQLSVGVPVSDFKAVEQPFVYGYIESFSNRYIGGIFGELRFGNRLSIEVGSLYHRVHLAGFTRAVVLYPQWSVRAVGGAWEFPVSGKYRFTRGTTAPFVAAGPALRRTRLSGDQTTVTYTGGLPSPVSVTTPVSESFVSGGWTIGSGLDMQLGKIRVSPQVRYVRFGAFTCVGCGPVIRDFPALNSVYVMLGAGF